MPFDPISVIGIVGTALGVLSFAASTAENIHSRIRNFEDCPRKLRGYHDTLLQADRELKHWLNLWSKGASDPRQDPQFYDEETYKFFWGQTGLEEISRRLADIGEQFKAVTTVLKCQTLGPPKQEVASWKQWLSQPRAANHSVGNSDHVTWIEKFLFTVYKDTTIERRVNGLEKRITELDRASASLFRLAHESRFKDPEPHRVRELGTLQQDRKVLLTSIDNWYHVDDRASDPDWHLVLDTPPLQNVLSRLKGESDIELSFQFCTAKAENPQLSEIDYSMDCASLGRKLEEAVRSQSQYPFIKHDALELHRLRPLDLSKMAAYTLAAQSAASSTALLHDSTWLYGFCFCGITLCETISSKITACFTPGDCDHILSVFRQNTFLLLSVLLAELALGAPLKVQSQDLFEVPDPRLPPGYANPVAWVTLMTLLGKARDDPEDYTSLGYHEAMKYAFKLGNALLTRQYMCDDIEVCINKIVTPLEKQHKLLSTRLADLQKRRWFNSRQGEASMSSA